MLIEVEGLPGDHVSAAAARAVEARRQSGPADVVLVFNDHRIPVEPGDTAGDVCAKYDAAGEAAHRAYMAPERVADREAKESEARHARAVEMQRAIAFVRTASEAELRDSTAPTPDLPRDLAAYVAALTERQHEYGTCVYAMSLAATATFNYVASALGVTGFQAGCADLDVLKRTRGLKWGKLLDFEKLLHPQYLTDEHYPSWRVLLVEHREELGKRAAEMLAKSPDASWRVVEHWRALVEAAK